MSFAQKASSSLVGFAYVCEPKKVIDGCDRVLSGKDVAGVEGVAVGREDRSVGSARTGRLLAAGGARVVRDRIIAGVRDARRVRAVVHDHVVRDRRTATRDLDRESVDVAGD